MVHPRRGAGSRVERGVRGYVDGAALRPDATGVDGRRVGPARGRLAAAVAAVHDVIKVAGVVVRCERLD